MNIKRIILIFNKIMESSKNTILPMNNTHTEGSTPSVDLFITQLTPLQQRALAIAREHLKTSFDLERSNGFHEWSSSIPK